MIVRPTDPEYRRWRDHNDNVSRRNRDLWGRGRRNDDRLHQRYENAYWRFFHRPG